MLSIIVGRLPLPTSRLRLGVERLLVAQRRSSALVLVLCLGLGFTLTLTLIPVCPHLVLFLTLTLVLVCTYLVLNRWKHIILKSNTKDFEPGSDLSLCLNLRRTRIVELKSWTSQLGCCSGVQAVS